MQILKVVSLALVGLVMILAIGGYLYFDKKFTPPSNRLEVENSDKIPITWHQNEISAMAALYLPIKIEGIDKTLYMQFDLGAPNTIFYAQALSSIESKYPKLLPINKSTKGLLSFSFHLGKMMISSPKFKTIDYGDSIHWEDSTSINVIGTIGSDLLEKKITILDFKEGMCYFRNTLPDSISEHELSDFNFEKRKVVLPATLNGDKTKVLFDTGTSAFEFLTSKDVWQKMSRPKSKPVSFSVNSWGNKLKAHNIASDKMIEIGSTKIRLNQVTYIEGASFVQELVIMMTGMEGMVGNKLFFNRVIILDGENKKFGVF